MRKGEVPETLATLRCRPGGWYKDAAQDTRSGQELVDITTGTCIDVYIDTYSSR